VCSLFRISGRAWSEGGKRAERVVVAAAATPHRRPTTASCSRSRTQKNATQAVSARPSVVSSCAVAVLCVCRPCVVRACQLVSRQSVRPNSPCVFDFSRIISRAPSVFSRRFDECVRLSIRLILVKTTAVRLSPKLGPPQR